MATNRGPGTPTPAVVQVSSKPLSTIESVISTPDKAYLTPRQASAASSIHSSDGGGIHVMKEVRVHKEQANWPLSV